MNTDYDYRDDITHPDMILETFTLDCVLTLPQAKGLLKLLPDTVRIYTVCSQGVENWLQAGIHTTQTIGFSILSKDAPDHIVLPDGAEEE